MDGINLALELTGYGLGGVFLSLVLLYVMIRVLEKLFVKKDEDSKGGL